jgi:LPXTG-site transpeptidase (sortase) family protein
MLNDVYTPLGDLWLEIPSLGVMTNIVGAPRSDGDWKVDWLGDQAGWLHGTAFPTWEGNSVVTAHVYLPNGLPGPFVDLVKLGWGDQVIVHAYGQRYIYEIRSNRTVSPQTSVFEHEEYPWLTLITCQGYDETSDSYLYRTVVRAVQVRIEPE